MLQRLKERPALLLIVGTMLVATPRYMEVAGFTVNFMVDSVGWGWVNFFSGIGMALLEGITIWYTWNSWNKAEWSVPGRKALMLLIVCLLTTLAGSVWFAMFARSGGSSLSETFSPFFRGVWAGCTTLAPFFVMASAGVAESVRDASATHVEVSVSDEDRQKLLHILPQESQLHISAPMSITEALTTYPDKSQSEIARMLGVSRQAVQKVARKATDV